MSPSLVRRLEWSGTVAKWSPAQDGRPCCPVCRGWKPGLYDGARDMESERLYGYTIGHRDGCEMAAEVAALPSQPPGGVSIDMLDEIARDFVIQW